MNISTMLLLAGALAAGGTQADQTPPAQASQRITIPSPDTIAVDRIAAGLRLAWSFALLPDGTMLVVEKRTGARAIDSTGRLGPVLAGMPDYALLKEGGAFYDLVLDPDFEDNRTVYLAFAEGEKDANRTAIWKARFDGKRLTDGRVIFRTNVPKGGSSSPAVARLLFLPDKTLLMSTTDTNSSTQDGASHYGKVLRLDREGAAPADNPFVGKPGFAPEVWTLGHRNIQGLARDPATGAIWAHEHGPRGGDEVNLLRPGLNYGWPLVTHGVNGAGKPISERAFGPGFEPPRMIWWPGVAPSGLAIYRGDRYPGWNGAILVGGLRTRSLVRLQINQRGLMGEEERMFAGLRARIRDVRAGPDGLIYILTESETDGMLLRLAPPGAAAN